MTDEQINIAIAEVCGTARPNYCSDLNAMHEAEKSLTVEQQFEYADRLVADDPPWSSIEWDCAHATARKRAEAFLRVLGKWEDL